MLTANVKGSGQASDKLWTFDSCDLVRVTPLAEEAASKRCLTDNVFNDTASRLFASKARQALVQLIEALVRVRQQLVHHQLNAISGLLAIFKNYPRFTKFPHYPNLPKR